jgi:predicted DNA-binding protein with PD1-like motif
MKSTELAPAGVRSFNLSFSRGDDPMAGLAEFAEVNHLTDCRFTAIGAFGSATLGWFDADVGAYKKIEVATPGEVVSMAGSIRMQNGKPFVHSHAVIAMSDGSTRAGHVLDAKVSLSLEVYITAGEPVSTTK